MENQLSRLGNWLAQHPEMQGLHTLNRDWISEARGNLATQIGQQYGFLRLAKPTNVSDHEDLIVELSRKLP